MNSVLSRSIAMFCIFAMTGMTAEALEVSVSPTSGGTFDLTPFADFVHFTATSTSAGAEDATLTEAGILNIPTVAVTRGTAFDNFSTSFNYDSAPGRISSDLNAFAVLVQYQNTPTPASNNRMWYGQQGQLLEFTLNVPAADGTMVLFTSGGSIGTEGEAILYANFNAEPAQTEFANFTAATSGNWGARFEVSWSGRTAGETLNLQFQNITTGDGGYGGVIAVAVTVPEPSTNLLGALATLTLAGVARRRRPSEDRPCTHCIV